LYFKVVLILLGLKTAAKIILELVNQHNVQCHAGRLPRDLKGVMNKKTYQKAVNYTLTKSRFAVIKEIYDSIILLLFILLAGFAFLYDQVLINLGDTLFSRAAYLFILAFIFMLLEQPFAYYSKFVIEERFGFNKSGLKLWLLDKVKMILLAVIIGYPLVLLLIKLVDWTGQYWWLWGFAAVIIFQIIMQVVYPSFIMPLFNKFTELKNKRLRRRLLKLAQRVSFKTRNIYEMDGSKRSAHSNAFFAGWGRMRRIVLFDTLIKQLKAPQLEAVLAHEIGHYKKGHIWKRLLFSFVFTLIMFYIIELLLHSGAFYNQFSFTAHSGALVPVLVLFSIFSPLITFWLDPVSNYFSRKHEYEADRYTAKVMRRKKPLINALKILSRENLTNLTPARAYSVFYYSHPTLWEREKHLKGK